MSLAERDFESRQYEYGSVVLSPARLELSVAVGEKCRGSFRILADGKELNGRVACNDYRMSVPGNGFCGKDLEVPFAFDAAGLVEGECVKGEFYVITDRGEYYLSYEIAVKGAGMTSELGEIKNLFHFANLAKVNWKEALACFYSGHFAHILTGSSAQYLTLYRGLTEAAAANHTKDSAMEEFLIRIRKKQEITYEYVQEAFVFAKEEVPDAISVRIRRNGWGYTELFAYIESGAGFLKPAKERLVAEDFENQTAELLIKTDRDGISPYGESGVLVVGDGRQSLRCSIRIKGKSAKPLPALSQKQMEKQLMAGMMHLYLDYRTGRRSAEECRRLAEDVLSHLRRMDALLPAMYEAHMKLLDQNSNEAVWLLKHAARILEGEKASPELGSYYRYLYGMAVPGQREEMRRELTERSRRQPDALIPYWALLHMEDLAKQNPGGVYRRLKELWNAGGSSPLLYLEAAMILLDSPMLLSVIDGFEMGLLRFMDRYGLIGSRVREQLYQSAKGVREYDKHLVALFQKYPAKERAAMVEAMCLQCMRGGIDMPGAAAWLREGIESGCRITGLYEGYVRALSFDPKEILPKPAVHYFAYDTSLDEAHLAYVYARVVTQKERIDAAYGERIRRFVLERLAAGKVDENLATLYRLILMPEDMTQERAERLMEISFSHLLTVESERCCACIVRHEGLSEQERYPVRKHRAVVQIYTGDYTVFFEDEGGRLYLEDEEGYRITPLLGYEKMKYLLKECRGLSFGAQYYLAWKNPPLSFEDYGDFSAMEEIYLHLLACDGLSREWRQELCGGLLCAYAHWERGDELDRYLLRTKPEDFSGRDCPRYVSLLCERGFYQEAFAAACAYGCEKTDERVMARLCQFMIEALEEEKDETLLCLVYRMFEKKKYTERMLCYLIRYFHGTVKQMRSVWRAAMAMEVEGAAVAERILEQILLTGAYISDREEIFSYYSVHEGRKSLIREYLCVRAHEYLVRGEEVEDAVFSILEEYLLEEEDMPAAASLAWLWYHSKCAGELSDAQRALCAGLLSQSLGAGIYFPCYSAYLELYPVLALYNEFSYVEYRTRPGITVTIHYIWDRSLEQEDVYQSESMTEIYPGIYQSAFRLFFGDRLQYYITEQTQDGGSFAVSGTVEQNGLRQMNGHGRFGLLNDIAISLALDDFDTADELAEEYARNEFVTDMILRLK